MNPTDPRQGPCPAESAPIVRTAPDCPIPPGSGWNPPWKARQLDAEEIVAALRRPRSKPCKEIDPLFRSSAFRPAEPAVAP